MKTKQTRQERKTRERMVELESKVFNLEHRERCLKHENEKLKTKLRVLEAANRAMYTSL